MSAVAGGAIRWRSFNKSDAFTVSVHLMESTVVCVGDLLELLLHCMFYYPRGINMRYLGVVAELSTCRTDLDHLFRLCITEMLNRAAKKLLANELHQGMCDNTVCVLLLLLVLQHHYTM